ncbi:DIE2/ALG10 family-domain-containing protein [Blastocladiella britannica]|nr:DIE2/ALG10 family-domain-containing protein [Blastocladiella britannica]
MRVAVDPSSWHTPLSARILTRWIPIALLLAAWARVATVVDVPYMDEPFHVPQAQAYCAGRFDVWDPKLTTPPGLYWLTLAILRPVALAVTALAPHLPATTVEHLAEFFLGTTHQQQQHASWMLDAARTAAGGVIPPALCSLPILRLVSTVLAAALLAVLTATMRDVAREQAVDRALAGAAANLGNLNRSSSSPTPMALSSASSDVNADVEVDMAVKTAMHQAANGPLSVTPGVAAWNAVNVWMQPIGAFFYVLYYTETASAVTVVAAYYLARRRWYWLGALVGFYSILIRQTNAIWLCFSAGATLVARIRHAEARRLLIATARSASSSATTTLPAWTLGTCPEYTLASWVTDHVAIVTAVASRYRAKAVRVLAPTVAALVGAAVLARRNGGLLAGDKDNHTFSAHIVQVFYCVCVVAATVAPVAVTLPDLSAYVVFTLRKLRSRRGMAVMTTVFLAMFAAVAFTTYEHPFILADNRHLTFYIWKNVFRAQPLARYLLVPVYFAAGWFLYRRIGHDQGSLWISVYAVAVSLTLIPSPLVEFRYFVLPATIYRLHVIEPKRWKLFLESLLHIATIVVMGYVFTSSEWAFEAQSEPGVVKRFMW